MAGVVVWGASLLLEPAEAPVVVEPAPKKDKPPRKRGGDDPNVVVEPPVELPEELPEVVDPEPVSEGLVFEVPEYERQLGQVNWKLIGETLFRLGRVLPQAGAAMSRGSGRGAEKPLTEAERLWTRLDGELQARHKEFGVRHPALVLSLPSFSANAMAKTLEAAGRPLDEADREALKALVVEYTAKDDAIAPAKEPDRISLDVVADRVELRTEFLEKARELLDKDQSRAVGGGAFADKVGLDAFCPSNVWRGRFMPLPADRGEEFVIAASDAMMGPMGGLSDPERERLLGFIREWTNELDPSLRNYRAGPLTMSGHLDSKRAIAAARATADLTRTVLSEFEMEGTSRMILQMAHVIMTPMRMP